VPCKIWLILASRTKCSTSDIVGLADPPNSCSVAAVIFIAASVAVILATLAREEYGDPSSPWRAASGCAP
jgi:hypothetical protein